MTLEKEHLKGHQGATPCLPPDWTATTSPAQENEVQAVSTRGVAVEGLAAAARFLTGFQTQGYMGMSWTPREVRTAMFTVRLTASIGIREVQPSRAEGQTEKVGLLSPDSSLGLGINLIKESPLPPLSVRLLQFHPSLQDQGLVALATPPQLTQAEQLTALPRLGHLDTRDNQCNQHFLHLEPQPSRPCIRRRA